MLTFLYNNASKVYAIFGYMWNTIGWYVNIAYYNLSRLAGSLFGTLYNVATYFYGAIQEYANTIRNYAYTFLVIYLGRMTSIIVSYYGTFIAYATVLYSYLSEYVNSVRLNIYWLIQNLWAYFNAMVAIGFVKFYTLLHDGADFAIQFATTFKSFLYALIGVRIPLFTLLGVGIYNALVDFAQNLYNTLRSFFDNYFPYVVQLWSLRNTLLLMVTVTFYNKVKALVETDFSKVFALAVNAANLLTLVNTTIFSRLIYLTGTQFGKIVDLLEAPQQNVLAMIENTFLPWFFNKLFDWLFNE